MPSKEDCTKEPGGELSPGNDCKPNTTLFPNTGDEGDGHIGRGAHQAVAVSVASSAQTRGMSTVMLFSVATNTAPSLVIDTAERPASFTLDVICPVVLSSEYMTYDASDRRRDPSEATSTGPQAGSQPPGTRKCQAKAPVRLSHGGHPVQMPVA